VTLPYSRQHSIQAAGPVWHVLVTGIMLLSGVACAQSTQVVVLGTPSASQLRDGLGFNISPANEWEFRQAQAIGSTEVRFQCGWSGGAAGVEQMTGSPSSGFTSAGYHVPAACVKGLTFSKSYGQRPVIVAAYGAPYQHVSTLNVMSAAGIGDYTIHVKPAAGSSFPACPHTTCEVYQITTDAGHKTTNSFVTKAGSWAYGGSLVVSTDGSAGTITLASALTVALPATNLSAAAYDQLSVNQLLYPPVRTNSVTDPSIIAYAGLQGASQQGSYCDHFPANGGYAPFLACAIYNQGLTGKVEIWNEPPWGHDPWDQASKFYDKLPAGVKELPVQDGFAASLQTQRPPGNVRYISAAAEKSGGSSVLGSRFVNPTAAQVEASLSSESFHPYGNNPEDGMWDPACLAAATASKAMSCFLPGMHKGSNAKIAIWQKQQKPELHFEQDITETGYIATYDAINNLASPSQIVKARFNLRQFLGYEALGLPHINFYRWADKDALFGFVDIATQQPTASYHSFKTMMQKIAAITGTGTTTPISALPSITGYSGAYALGAAYIRATDSSNATLVTCWQMSATTGTWSTLTSPVAGTVTMQLPTGKKPGGIYNLNSGSSFVPALSWNAATRVATFTVEDDPVVVLVQ
jgi:hypothetical protein